MLWGLLEGSLWWENIEVHVLTEGIFTENFVGFARRVHVKLITQILLLRASRTVIHVNVPVRIGTVIAGGD